MVAAPGMVQTKYVLEFLQQHWAAFAVGAAGAAAGLWLLRRSRGTTEEQRERERRQHINRVGRITDGNVSDVQEMELNGRAAQLIVYNYNVAGVQYECSQDVTSLRHLVDLQSCRIGVTTSVRYDPLHPRNSIVVTEGWTGLRR